MSSHGDSCPSFVLTVLSVLFFSILVPLPPVRADSLLPNIRLLVDPYIDSRICQSLAIGLWQNGKAEFYGAGVPRKGDRDAPTEDTIYEIGSISKTFTGLLLADAVVRGTLKLETPIQDIINDIQMSFAGAKDITLLHLATHTSGLPPLPTNIDVENFENPLQNYGRRELLEFLGGEVEAKPVGKQIEYSNLGVGILGELLAMNAGTTYEELLKSRILIPLQMKDTMITMTREQLPRAAQPYRDGSVAALSSRLGVLAGAGEIRSTVADMLNYIACMINPPSGDLGRALELAYTIHQEPIVETDFPIGLCWHVTHDGHTRWHNGETAGFHSMVMLDREKKIGVVVLSNTATDQVDILASELMSAMAGEVVKPRVFEKPQEVDPKIAARYVGRYELTPEFILEISQDEQGLTVQATNQPAFRIYPSSETEWSLRVVDATITFKSNAKGEWNELVLFQNGIHQSAIRMANDSDKK